LVETILREVRTVELGRRLRELRKAKALTLRGLAEKVGVDFSYLSKIENNAPGYSPSADTLRTLAAVLDAEPLELLELADKVPPEVESLASSASARRFMRRAQEIASPDDWDALLSELEKRVEGRPQKRPTRRKA
jgi:transcriptional regulator with XRE-family HTH domain